jgi:hypothetical protein
LVNVDPSYVNFAGDNFALQDGSQAIDAATDAVGEDRNGGGANNYYGLAPDMGYLESNY